MSTGEGGPPISRGLLIGLGVVLGLVALFALYTFVISPLLSEDEDLADPGAPSASEPLVSPEPGATGSGAPGSESPFGEEAPGLGEDGGSEAPSVAPTPPQQVAEVFEARDPFQQLVVEPVTAAGDGTPGDGGTSGLPGSGATPTASPGGSTGGDGDTDGSTATPTPTVSPGGTASPGATTSPGASPGATASPQPPSDADVGTTRVTLDDVFTDDEGREAVLVTVNGSTFQVNEGETFATSFRVLDISPPCATFLFGDSRFTLCKGERIRK